MKQLTLAGQTIDIQDAATLIVWLHDGRTMDLSGLPVDDVVDHLRGLGITADHIRATIHIIRSKVPR